MATSQKAEEEWPTITRLERIYYEILFYSQGPLDGYLLGERACDLFLHSRLPLMTLSRIWNLADVTNDNVLSVDEFVLAMHLTRGILRGKKVPKVLPHSLKPMSSTIVQLPHMSDKEKEAYLKVFQTLDVSRKGVFEGTFAREVLQSSELSPEQLVDVWDLSDLNKDGCLDMGEWTVACQLVRLHKQGYNLEGSINAFTYLPDRISQNSLQARKQRVNEYDGYKQRLMSIKEKRKAQAVQESRRLQLLKDKIALEKELYNILSRLGKSPISEDRLSRLTDANTQEVEKLEEIIARLKKEHEKIRQDTVKVILGEHRLQGELNVIKEETVELNKRLATLHSKATKDPDPFHQLYEQRREERKKSNLSEGEEPEVHLPFTTNPFDKDAIDTIPVTGADLFLHSSDNNNSKHSKENAEILSSLHSFGEELIALWSSNPPGKSPNKRRSFTMEDEEDTVFMAINDDEAERVWSSVGWVSEDTVGPQDSELIVLHRKLVDLKEEMKKLNRETGGKLVFRNPSDYLARKKAKEEEEQEKSKPKRSKSSIDSEYAVKRRSWIDRRKDLNDATTQEIRSKRLSLNLDHKTDSGVSPRKTPPDRPQRLPVRLSDSQIPVATDRSRRDLNPADVSESAESKVPVRTPRRATSPTTSPSRSTKKTRAPPPPNASDPADLIPVRSPRRSKQVDLTETTKQEEKSSEREEKKVVGSPSRPPRKKCPSSSASPDRAISVPSSDLPSKPCDKQLDFASEPDFIPDSPLVNGDVHVTLIAIDHKGDNSTENGHLSVHSIDNQNLPVQISNIHLTSKETPEGSLALSNGHLRTSEIFEEPTVRVEKSRAESVPQLKSAIFDDSIVDEEVELTLKTFSKQTPDGVSLTESIHSAHSGTSNDSFVPNLPSSPPPLLALGGTPKALVAADSVEEEVIDVVISPRVEYKPFVHEDTIQSVAEADIQCAPIDEEVIQAVNKADVECKPIFSEDFRSVNKANVECEPVREEVVLSVVSTDIECEPPVPEEVLQSVTNADIQCEPVHDEVVEITKEAIKETQPDIIQREVTSPGLSVSELRAEFFGLNKKPRPAMSEEIVFEDDFPQTNGHVMDSMDVYINDLKTEVKMKDAEQKDEESDVSDGEQPNGHFKATFTPGEAQVGNVPIDVAFDDDTDGGIQLISFNTTVENSFMLQSPGEQSQTDSAFDEMMSNTDHDNSNQVSLCNTLEDFQEQDEEEVVIETTEVRDIEEYNNPQEEQVGEVDEIIFVDSDPQESEPEAIVIETVEVVQEVKVVESTPWEPEPEPIVMETMEVVREARVESTPMSDYQEPESPSVEEVVPETKVVVTSPPDTPRHSSYKSGLRDTSSIVQKARNFSDIITEPPKITVKATTKEVSEERLKQMDLERKAILQQSMKASKAGNISYSDEDEEVVEDNRQSSSVGVTSVQPWQTSGEDDESDYKVALRSTISWDEKPDKVNLYSANVAEDGKTTEVVDRESIADLGLTRNRWENLFQSSATPSPVAKTTPKQGSVKHWDVKLPYKPLTVVSSVPVESTVEEPPSEQNMDDYTEESAIAREIRLANEREDMLKREHEERMELKKRQDESKEMQTKVTFEAQNNNNNELKTMYHEMTEADRGSELQRRETIIKQEIEEQQEREQAVSQNSPSDSEELDTSNEQTDATESVIAREIRLQQEREDEIACQNRKVVSPPPPPVAPPPLLPSEPVVEQEDAEESEISYEEAIGAYHHEGENLIARELRETREREEELKRMRETLSKEKSAKESPISVSKQPVQKITPQKTEPVKATKSYVSPSVQFKSPSQVTPNRNVFVTMMSPVTPPNQGDAVPSKKSETPIEKEIRLARERENELRRQKGLPDIVVPEEVTYNDEPVSNGTEEEFTPVVAPYRNFRSEKSAAMKNFGSSRLQKELEKQRVKEMALKQEGIIKSTSEEHIQTFRYMEIDTSSKPVKRNFNIQRRSNSNMSNESERTPSEHSDTDSLKDMPVTPVAPPREELPARFKRSISSGSNVFSYKETTQKAESKIEKELREMREREEELRVQREEIAAARKAMSPS